MSVKLGLLTLREEHGLERIFGPKRNEMTGGGRKLHMRSFLTCTLLQV
jgi:hypothetical protein